MHKLFLHTIDDAIHEGAFVANACHILFHKLRQHGNSACQLRHRHTLLPHIQSLTHILSLHFNRHRSVNTLQPNQHCIFHSTDEQSRAARARGGGNRPRSGKTLRSSITRSSRSPLLIMPASWHWANISATLGEKPGNVRGTVAFLLAFVFFVPPLSQPTSPEPSSPFFFFGNGSTFLNFSSSYLHIHSFQ